MKKLFSTLIILIWGFTQINAQISLHGTVSVQNSKTNTGKTEHVPNAQIECDKEQSAKAQPKTSDSEGKFTLEVDGKKDMQIAILVTPKGKYQDYVIVNEKEIKDITLGRVLPVSVYICQKGELEERRAAMVDVNMKKYRDQIEMLQKEFNQMKSKYDYENTRYKVLENQIDSLSKAEKETYLLIKGWAESLTTINLDDATEAYIKAYNCFANGYIDSVNYYLPDKYLKQQQQQLLRQQEEGTRKIETGKILMEAGRRDIEITTAALADNVKSWMLKAKAMALEYNYEQAINYYEEAIHTDTLNADNIFEYAKYLFDIREYAKSEIYYQKCLEIRRQLAAENPKTYLSPLAKTLTGLGILHVDTREYSKTSEEYEEALTIFKKLAEENPKTYLSDVAITLNNLGVLHWNANELKKALEEYEEALTIYKKLIEENPNAYLPVIAAIQNNLGLLYKSTYDYAKSLEKYEEALLNRRKLAEENPKKYLLDVAITLNNLGLLHTDMAEYPTALKEYEETLKIYRNYAEENPNAYTFDVARTLLNLSILRWNINDYQKAIEECEEALKMTKKLAAEHPKAYLPYVTMMLGNLSAYYLCTKQFTLSEQSARQALELDGTMIWVKANLAPALLFQNRFSEAETLYKELSQTIYQNNETFTQPLLDDLKEFEKTGVIPEERKADVEKIRKMLSEP